MDAGPSEHSPQRATLGPLCQDHAAAMRHARYLLAASSPASRRAALDAFITSWRTRLSEHFDDEERLLLPLIAQCECRRRVLAEHEELRRMASAAMLLGPDPDPAWIQRLGQLLHDHIQWEDDDLFPHLDRSLSPESRQSLAAAAARIEKRRGEAPHAPIDSNITDA
jgi:hypothetical protein